MQEYEQRIAKNETDKEQDLQQLTVHYEGKLQEKNMQLEQAAHEQEQQLKEAEELQKQTEEDVDREILDLKNRYERQLRQRWEENTKLRGEVGILTKKVICSLFQTHILELYLLWINCKQRGRWRKGHTCTMILGLQSFMLLIEVEEPQLT